MKKQGRGEVEDEECGAGESVGVQTGVLRTAPCVVLAQRTRRMFGLSRPELCWCCKDRERFRRLRNCGRFLAAILLLLGLMLLALGLLAVLLLECLWVLYGPIFSPPLVGAVLAEGLLTFIVALVALLFFVKVPMNSRYQVRTIRCFLLLLLVLVLLGCLVPIVYVFHSLNYIYRKSSKDLTRNVECDDDVRFCWDSIQFDHMCCGIFGYSDWKMTPLSCCNERATARNLCTTKYILKANAFREGCYQKLYLVYIIFSFILWIGIPLLLLVLLCLLCTVMQLYYLMRSHQDTRCYI